MVSVHYGFDYFADILNAALGIEPELAIQFQKPCAAELLISRAAGVITHLENHNDKADDIVDISFDYGVGDTVRNFSVGPDRIGQLIVTGDSYDLAMKRLEAVRNNIELRVNGELA